MFAWLEDFLYGPRLGPPGPRALPDSTPATRIQDALRYNKITWDELTPDQQARWKIYSEQSSARSIAYAARKAEADKQRALVNAIVTAEIINDTNRRLNDILHGRNPDRP